MPQFKIGDKVYLRKDSEYYDLSDSQLPPNIIGIVDEVGSGFDPSILVHWEDGVYGKMISNYYKERDLETTSPLIHPTIKRNN